jgi:hypothetical protein
MPYSPQVIEILEANAPAFTVICEFETDCGHTIAAMRDDSGREWVTVKKPGLSDNGDERFLQTPFLKTGTAAGAAEDIWQKMQF